MPPKRRRADAEAQPAVSSSRTTRSATRSEGVAAEVNSTSNLTRGNSKSSAISTPKAPPKKKTKGSRAQPALEDPKKPNHDSEEKLECSTPRKTGKGVTKQKSILKSPPNEISVPPVTCSLYSRISMEELFAKYADEEDPSAMGSEGFEKLCVDAKIPMDGAQPLLLAWLLSASELGRFQREEWIQGLDALQIDTLEKLGVALSEYEDLLISDVPAPHSQNKTRIEPYNRSLNYWRYAVDVPKAYLAFYTFLFVLAKAPQERNIDIEIAKALWETLLSNKYPIVNDLIAFINGKGTIRGVSKDLWGMTLEFCRTFNTSLEGYEPDGAWPTLLDEFYAFQLSKQHPNATDGEIHTDRFSRPLP